MPKVSKKEAKIVVMNKKDNSTAQSPKAPIVAHVRNIVIKRLTPMYKTGVLPAPDSLKRSFTLAAVIEGEKVKIGYAVCSENDNFNKVIGRQIAVSRAEKAPITTKKLPKKVDIKVITNILYKEAMRFPTKNEHLFDFEKGLQRAIAKRNKK